MILTLAANDAPIEVSLSGKISEADYSWNITPFRKTLERFDLNRLYLDLYKLKRWAKNRGIDFKLKAHWLFKSAFFFFCKAQDEINI